MIKVACALIQNHQGAYLVVQRSTSMSHPLKWEFPGGKIKAPETAAQAIQREIREELALEVRPLEELQSVHWEYPQKKIDLVPIICELRSGKMRLNEHNQHMWLKIEEMYRIDLLEADKGILNQLNRNS